MLVIKKVIFLLLLYANTALAQDSALFLTTVVLPALSQDKDKGKEDVDHINKKPLTSEEFLAFKVLVFSFFSIPFVAYGVAFGLRKYTKGK